MEDCAKATAGQTCDDSLDNSQLSACTVPGSNADGTACGSEAQCQSGYCRLMLGSLCGTCAKRAAAGGQCVVDADCQATLVCASGTCTGPGQVGASCSGKQPCLRSLTCVSGSCQAPLQAGAACLPTDCDVAHGLYCDIQSKKCTQTQVAQVGQPCGLVNGVLVACAGGASCANVKSGQGTCHPPAPDGAPCGPDIPCLAPAICTSTARCTLPNPSVCH
jgi:hypothetical protein